MPVFHDFDSCPCLIFTASVVGVIFRLRQRRLGMCSTNRTIRFGPMNDTYVSSSFSSLYPVEPTITTKKKDQSVDFDDEDVETAALGFPNCRVTTRHVVSTAPARWR